MVKDKGVLFRIVIFLCAITLLYVAVVFLDLCLNVNSATKIDCAKSPTTFLPLNSVRVAGDDDENPSACCLNSNVSEPIAQATSKARSRVASVHRRPYLFFMEITEQLSSNSLKFFQLSYFSTVWNFNMVEPWIDNNTEHLSSLPPTEKTQALRFFDLYNKTSVQKMLTKCYNSNLPQDRQMDQEFVFHTMSEAMMYSPREILLVRFMAEKSDEWTINEKEMHCGVCDNISGSVSNGTLKALNSHLQEFKIQNKETHSQSGDFRIWKTVCISSIPGTPFSMKNATTFIQRELEEKRNQTNGNVSVVIQSWRSIVKVRRASYYVDPTFTFDTHQCPYRSLPHSSIVSLAVDRMRQAFNLTDSFISIYVRTERLAREDLKKEGTMEDCFKKLLAVLNTSKALYEIPQSRVVLVHDAGKYGSQTFHYRKGARERSSTFLTRFPLFNISTVHYDPNENKDFPQHRAFVAAVEQEFLSQSHVLVTMGGGGFSMNVWGRFTARQSKKRLHVLCPVAE